ncbi:electron transfer flavoprotein, beta subunit [Pelotomaculum thermopropionicum SI]|uniref:Electron transfer flavoprotein small subunit n=1 Tax=Pelotomaculum thermopropionicum (strain DSM 13744 / JCM 10971 / SI) TaxID=370438 RepID=A5CZH9_PELTS|nr:electron transfer flavoprotein, beta subunit [Pelotomaculum thermopropionicum SI]
MKVLVCYKWVLDEADIFVNEQDLSLNFDKAKGKINEYDRNAIELGASLKETVGCELYAATVGKGVKASVNDVLSRGPEKVFYMDSPGLDSLDSSVTARLLAAMIKKIGGIDLVICGEGSSDFYSRQVGPRIAALLGYASLSYAVDVQVNGSEIIVTRKLDDGTEVVKVSSPAVISVLPEINKPRIPSLKQILAAKKKPSTSLALEEIGLTEADLATSLTFGDVAAAIMERKRIRIDEGCQDISEAVAKLIKQLRADRVLN